MSYSGVNYTAAYWSQGSVPAASSGPSGSGLPWVVDGSCNGGSATPTASPAPTPTASPAPTPTNATTQGPPPAMGFIFSPYKDVTASLNWNTNVLSSADTGSLQPLLSVMPAKDSTITLAFATGSCGSETWGGVSPASLIAANIPAFASSSKYYIVSTGGANGAFTCASTSAFVSFVRSYYSSHMLGVDFDIEGGQTATDIANLVQDVKAAESVFPTMRFSFTLQTLGGSGQGLNVYGVEVMNSIKSTGLTSYTINLMTMDFGSASPYNCVVNNGVCDMGASAGQAAIDLHTQFGVPYNQIELTPMIGLNDNSAETFTIANAATLSAFVRQNGLAGVRFWSFDRDKNCGAGDTLSTCNYQTDGSLGFTNAFISDLGL